MTDSGDSVAVWPIRRFSQAISEGDGISVIPLVRDPAEAEAAAAAGAEALAVQTVAEIEAVRGHTELPVLLRAAVADEATLRAMRAAGADACVLVYEELGDADGLLEELVEIAWGLGLDCALDVRDDDELAATLERVDPEILVLSERDREHHEVENEVALELLPDVPAGKLVVADSGPTTRDQVLELERAGVDAVLVGNVVPPGHRYSAALAELTGRAAER